MKTFKRYATAKKHTSPGNLIIEIGYQIYVANVPPYSEISIVRPDTLSRGRIRAEHLIMGNHNQSDITTVGTARAKAIAGHACPACDVAAGAACKDKHGRTLAPLAHRDRVCLELSPGQITRYTA